MTPDNCQHIRHGLDCHDRNRLPSTWCSYCLNYARESGDLLTMQGLIAKSNQIEQGRLSSAA